MSDSKPPLSDSDLTSTARVTPLDMDADLGSGPPDPPSEGSSGTEGPTDLPSPPAEDSGAGYTDGSGGAQDTPHKDSDGND